MPREDILLVTRYFPPEPGAAAERLRAIARYVSDTYPVRVLTASVRHTTGGSVGIQKNVTVTRLFMPSVGTRLMQRLFAEVWFSVAVMLKSLFLARPRKVIISSPPFTLVAVAFFWKYIKRTPYVLDIRDRYPESFVAMGVMSTTHPLLPLMHNIERLAYTHASAVIVVSEAGKAVVNAIAPHTPVVVSYNGVDIDRKQEPIDTRIISTYLPAQKVFTIMYAGALGFSEHIQTLLDALLILKQKQPAIAFHCVIIGEGSKRKEYEAFVQNTGLCDQVTFTGMLDKAIADALLTHADVGVCLKIDEPLMTQVIPSKIFEYMFANVPLILGIDGEAADIVRTHQAGIVQQSTDVTALVANLLEMYHNPAVAQTYVKNGQHLITTRFNRKKAVAAIIPYL